jgi:hypothetical protein
MDGALQGNLYGTADGEQICHALEALAEQWDETDRKALEEFHLIEKETPGTSLSEQLCEAMHQLDKAVEPLSLLEKRSIEEKEESAALIAKQILTLREDEVGVEEKKESIEQIATEESLLWSNIYTTPEITNSLLRALSPIASFCSIFVDGKDPWKVQHYEVRMEQVKEIFHPDKMKSLCEKLAISGNDEIIATISQAAETLTDKNLDIHRQKTTFITHIREALRLLRENSSDPNLSTEAKEAMQTAQKELNGLCTRWLTELCTEPFYSDVVLYVASKGNEEIYAIVNDPNVELHEKFEAVLKGIETADSKYKAPTFDLNVAKLYNIMETYDSLKYQNSPSKIASMQYKKEDGTIHEVTEFRLGVPINQATTSEREKGLVGQHNGVSLVPEYIAFLEDLRERNRKKQPSEPKEKLLAVLHLDPKYYNSDTRELKSCSMLDPKGREALWIKILDDTSFSEEYKDVLSVAIVPMDGAWLKEEIQKCTDSKSIDWLKEHLRTTILQDDSLFLIPNMTTEEKGEFVESILEMVEKQYFSHLKGKELSSKQMLAFVGFFDSRLIEMLTLKEGANYLQRNCKDAVDRTMALLGAELMDKLLRLGSNLSDPAIVKWLLGIVCGPALTILKRELLEERQPILLAVAEYTDALRQENILVDNDTIYEGYTLAKLDMEERHEFALKASAAMT